MIIDRIENQTVICEEDGQTIELPIDRFIQPIQDGDIVIKNQEGLYEVDKEVTEKGLLFRYPEGWRSLSTPLLIFKLEIV